MKPFPFAAIFVLATLLCFLIQRDWPSMAAFGASMLAFIWEMQVMAGQLRKDQAAEKLGDLEVRFTALLAQFAKIGETADATSRQAEEVRKLISQTNLASAFARKA